MGRIFSLVVFIAIGVVCVVVSQGCASRGESLSLSGALETDDIDHAAPFAAELIGVRVAEGDIVSVGDTLAFLDTTIVAAGYRAAQAVAEEAAARLADIEAGTDAEKIAAARAETSIVRKNAEQSERDLVRAQKLFDEKLIDVRRYEQYTLTRDNAQSALTVSQERLADLRRGARAQLIEAARANVARATAEVSARLKDFSRAILVAKSRGVVGIIAYQIGEIVPAGKALISVHDPNNLWANIYIPEARLHQAPLGDTVTFTVDAFPDSTFRAVITHIASSAEFTPRNVQTKNERVNLVFAVKVRALTGHPALRAGMPADFILPAPK